MALVRCGRTTLKGNCSLSLPRVSLHATERDAEQQRRGGRAPTLFFLSTFARVAVTSPVRKRLSGRSRCRDSILFLRGICCSVAMRCRCCCSSNVPPCNGTPVAQSTKSKTNPLYRPLTFIFNIQKHFLNKTNPAFVINHIPSPAGTQRLAT